MASDSEDSEGEQLCMLRPKLIRELQNVLDQYPDDGQILKEVIQNAEDAGATEVKVLTDKRTFHQDLDPGTLKKHPHLKFFQGPALCVYNNAQFTAKDWDGIRMLHTSIKEEDPLKVGRFGLGFKSVFHLTDRLVILSGKYIMYMDPFKGEDRYCKRHRIAGRKRRELDSILTSLEGIFGVSRDMFQEGESHFPGTLFWFPLRQTPSELSKTVYHEHNVAQLLASFKAEASSLLLFLNRIVSVTVLSRSDTQPPEELFSVGVASSSLQMVQSERQRFVEAIKSGGGELPENEVACLTEVVMETRDHLTSSRESQRWLVASYHSGRQEMSLELLNLCSDPQFSYRPHVGVAIPLSGQSSFQSQIFCFLPLPLDTRSPTGLPVHVHGYFALEQNRRHLKWPTADQLANHAQLEEPSHWNCLLVTELLPTVYCKAICRLKELYSSDAEKFYAAWPDVQSVQDRWRPLLQPLYTLLEQQAVFHSHIHSGIWVLLRQAVLQRFSWHFSPEVVAAVIRVYTLGEQKLVDLPEHVYQSLKEFGLLRRVEVIQASKVKQLIQNHLLRLTRDEKLYLLHYLYQFDKQLLLDLPLLPLADGIGFGTFKARPKKNSKKSGLVSFTYWCPEELAGLFPGLETEFCDFSVPEEVADDLSCFAQTELSTLDQLHMKDPRVAGLLRRSLQARFQAEKPAVHSKDTWMQNVWQYLATLDDLSPFSDIPLVPMKVTLDSSSDGSQKQNLLALGYAAGKHLLNGYLAGFGGAQPECSAHSDTAGKLKLYPLAGVYVCKCADGSTPLPEPLASALSKLSITVVEELPDYVIRHRRVLGTYINYPSNQGILKAIRQIDAAPTVRQTAVSSFNAGATGEEKAALVQFINTHWDGGPLPSVFQQLELFTNVLTRQPASVDQVPTIGPEDLPPVAVSAALLLCNSSERAAAVRLGAREMTVLQLAHGIMENMAFQTQRYSRDDVIKFMKYFLRNKELMKEPSLLATAKEIRFVRTESGELKKAGDLYDPTSSLLKELFHSQHSSLFPSGEFAQADTLKKLAKLGLRNEKEMKETDIENAAKGISNMCSQKQHKMAEKISQAMFTYLKNFGQMLSTTALQTIATIQCLPCVQDAKRPKDYPKTLPLKSSPAVAKPAEMSSVTLLYVTGSVKPTLTPGLPEEVVQHLQVTTEAQPEDVLQHLKNILVNFQQEEASQYKLVLKEVFQSLADYRFRSWAVRNLQEENCVLVETGNRFARPDKFWIHSQPGDIDLKPFRFPLPVETASPGQMEDVRALLQACGSSERQDDSMLHQVLSEIESKHLACRSSHPNFHTDFPLVKQILDVLKRSDTACDGYTLLPVFNPDHSDVLRFMAAKDCTICPGSPSSMYQNAHIDAGFEIYFVHPDISSSTAVALGAKNMKERALTEVEELDYSYGQHEDLTDRLSNLLKESYTDGFSVPKELIQNADDAGATKVCFLLDERENLASRSNLIHEEMASLQGPALWAYNDAEFSDADFENIVKLGSGTKREDSAKVGRFGLGFNAVYNLTEGPSFISRDRLAMFDPQVKYIRKGRGGLKFDFTKTANKALLGRMPEQFEPFQGVFGCTLKSDRDIYFEGTLFRFPLRTPDQAASSKLKKDSYTEVKRREFLRMLLEKAGTLLMFTQNVKQIEVYFLPSHISKPTDKLCLLTVKKKNSSTVLHPPQVQLGSNSILQFMKDHWSYKNKDIKIKQKVSIELKVTEEAQGVCGVEASESVTHWQVAWASGVNRSAKMVPLHKQEGLVPLAAVAVSVTGDQLIPLKDSPSGFYNRGHLFCFLPLPEEMVRFSLPVHINGTFALTSDRKGLLLQTEDDLEVGESSWNPVLFDDPVVRAYLLLLELLKKEAAMDDDYHRYFELWPTGSMGCLVDSFYQHLHSDHNKVFPVPGQGTWVSFQEARFLQPDFRESACGKMAWECMQRFWKGPGYLVDVPHFICNLMKEKGPRGAFEQQVITELAFYRDFFFPHLHDQWWQPEQRDRLLHHALTKNDQQINQLIKDSPCVPCQHSSQLRRPSELIHPSGQVSKLFLPSEGYFPQTGTVKDKDRQGVSKVDFCDHTILARLSGLGMVKDDLPWERVLERAESVGQLNADRSTEDESLNRASYLIEYLASSLPASRSYISQSVLESCPESMTTALSETAFLPVLPKPDEWPFIWVGETPTNGRLLAPPRQLFSDSLANLVSCSVKLLDTKMLKGSARYLTGSGKIRDVLKALGLTVDESYSDKQLRDLAVQQLMAVVKHCKTNSNVKQELIQSVSTKIYSYLTTCLKHAEKEDMRDSLHAQLCDKEVVWTGTEFVHPSRVAFSCQYDCSPYLFQIERSLLSHRLFFETVGVKARFETDDVLSVMETLYEEYAGEILPDGIVTLMSHLAQLVGEMVKTSPQPLDTSRVYLPDSDGVLQPASLLCVDDCEWLTQSDRMKFVHGRIAAEIAGMLGVKTKKRQDFDTLTELLQVESFGQHEKLTSRIERLLQGYTFDSSLWKELIQNADDAGATEAKLIMDFRQLQTETVPEKWEVLQGPAVCFYNNRSFTKADMQGIQNLGQGSKGQDALKIGQFGVGFNAVFHITDVPSFWTKEDDERDVICVLDPNCQYVPNTERDKPGIKFNYIERVKEQYPDFMSGYLSKAIDMSQSGTLFRFPLRTAEMAKASEIKKEAVSKEMIQKLLGLFKDEMSTCLLFLNNLQKLGIYCVKPDGALHLQYEVSKTLEDACRPQAAGFRTSLQQASESLKRSSMGVQDIDVCESVEQFSLSDSTGRSEQWLTVHRLGFTENRELSPALQEDWSKRTFRVLPRGGVAVRLAGTGHAATQKARTIKHQAFCTLPLPVFTSLPMHVNGHFALDHETRRNLWDSGNNKGDVKSEWNEIIVMKIVVPAYITALQRVRDIFFPADWRDLESTVKNRRLQQYHGLFPHPSETNSEIWNNLTKEIYRTLAKKELALFPVNSPEQPELEWMPAVRKDGFPGFFNNLMDQIQTTEPEMAKPVVTSQAGVSKTSNSKTSDKSKAKKLSEELELILKRSNMKVLEAPFCIYKDFKSSGVEDVQEVTPSSVVTFLRSSSGQRVHGGCCISGLPKNVRETPLHTAEDVQKLVKFISKDQGFLESLDGLPLSFRQSGTLHWFSNTGTMPKPILSNFSHLLPGSADEFLHENIRKFFHVNDQTKSMLQELDIQMLHDRLHLTLTDSRLRAGKPCMFEKPMFPSKSWLVDLWRFFETQLKPKNTSDPQKKDGASGHKKAEPNQQKVENTQATEKIKSEEKEIREKASEMLQIMNKWCLIPAKKVKESKGQQSVELSMLYPLQDLHKVVYLPVVKDQSNGYLWTILKKLPLPFLDQLAPSSVASKLVASIGHPRALLHALVSCANCLSESHGNGRAILSYFTNNLDILEHSSANQTELKSELRQLPVFPAIDEKLVAVKESVPVICLSSSVPQKGLCQWSQQRNDPLTLLYADYIPPELIEYLGFEKVSRAQFYAQYLLPSIDRLPRPAIFHHMNFLRENFFRGVYTTDIMNEDQKHLSCQLKDTAFIEISGTLYKARDFYDPQNSVFMVMCPERFPPEPYNSMEWEGLMSASGMIRDITDDMFLSFARELERDRAAGITQEVVTKSQTLVQHLFTRQHIVRSSLLGQVRSIQFLIPLGWMSTPEGEKLQRIAPPYCGRRLVSFAESCLKGHLHLVWSSSCLMDSYADPRCFFNFDRRTLNTVMSQLGLQERAPKDKVIQHARNLCNRLGGEEGSDIFASLANNKRLLIIVMETLYRYMEDHLKDNDLAAVRELKIICDIDNSQMLQPANVVMDLRDHEKIKGHIEKAPHHFGRYFDLFKKLGAAQKVTANHYARVLSWMKTQAGNEELDVEELKIVKIAVEGLFRCLKEDTEEQRRIEVGALYLPTEEKSLQASTQLIFKDDYLGERFQTPPDGRYFFLGFEKLEIRVSLPQDEIRRLPREHRVALLSELVHEVIPDEIRSVAEAAHESNPLALKLAHCGLIQAIVRLVYHQHKTLNRPFTEETARQVVQTLNHVSVKEVPRLRTVLVMGNEQVMGTERSKTSFTENLEGSPKRAVVYMTAKATREWRTCGETCVHSLALAVQFVICVHLDSYFLHRVLHHPEQARTILNEARVPPCTFGSELDEAVFPPAGAFVPLKFHHHLINGFFDFDPGEHVGYEVDDPQIDGDSSDNSTDNSPVFIYGIILCEVHHPRAENASRLSRRYLVDLGPHRGRVEVNIIRLYKFVRRGRGQMLVAVAEQPEEPEAEASRLPELRVALAEIRSLLTEAWQVLDQKDRKRVVKRLLLQWHPDKNPGNTKLCTEVTQAILNYVKLLEEGKKLPSDDAHAGGNAADNEHFFRSSSTFGWDFFTNMHARGRRHREDFDSEARRGGQGRSRSRRHGRHKREANPQPGEGSRWFRQAQADVNAAKAAAGSCERGHNWICYQCHQAVEKALKAVLFQRDADGFEEDSSDLVFLAESVTAVQDSPLVDLVQRLESRIGPHLRMRYPDVMVYPRIPAEVYGQDDAAFACQLASQILDHCQRLMRG